MFATVGFGDITPRTELARLVVTAQMLVGLIAVGVVAKVLFGAARTSSRQRSRSLGHTDDEVDG